jgi:acyl-CoA synthetase (AMP-forming)/AMP-acid ligase II
MTDHRSFAEGFAAGLAARPDRTGERDALVVLRDGAAGAERLSYGELDRRVRVLAAWLQEQRAAGERILIAQSDPVQFALSLLACLCAGAIAVPAPVPGGPHSHDRRLLGIVRDAAVRIAITGSEHASALSHLLAMSGHEDVACLAADRMLSLGSAPDPDAWRVPSLPPDTLALLQYTSGATGDPRGVMVTHGNLEANLAAIGRVLGGDPQQVVGGWLPLHHDMGLVGQLLYPLRLGATSVLMSPAAFARRPAAWLEMISAYGVGVSGGPNSAYELCVQRAADDQLHGVDLSGWRVAVNGAEPVRSETVQAFERRFARFGLRPGVVRTGYGLAEATLLVSCSTGAGRPRVRPRPAQVQSAADWHSADSDATVGGLVTGCGLVEGHELLIVDPDTREPLPDGRVGEIWLRGPSVARGYWRRPRETSETFAARTEDGRGGYLRTGDLGLVEDGELYVTGRLGDVMVVEGRNLHPQDVEHAVRGVSPLFGAGVVFPVRGARDHVVVVQEVRADPAAPADLAGLAREVRERVSAEFEARAEAVVLVRPGTVRRTTSGKLERAAVRRLLLDGRLESLHELIEPAVRRFLPVPVDR